MGKQAIKIGKWIKESRMWLLGVGGSLVVIVLGLFMFGKIGKWLSGLTLSLVLAHLIVSRLLVYLRENINKWKRKKDEPDITLYNHNTLHKVVGYLERLVYTFVIFMGGAYLYFIPLWLGFKVIGRWTTQKALGFTPIENPKSEADYQKNSKAATVVVNHFLIGTLLSLIFAVGGAWIIKEEIRITRDPTEVKIIEQIEVREIRGR
ncbi:MAG: hypothetical protein JSW17_06210 [Candidatus Omnitrophota bacterium]|nr:MAG: hypothetical protein JSW17_06210 [Candidatus Omnitrophota bacterium]